MTGDGDFPWAEIRRAYEDDALTVKEICQRFAIAPGRLARRRSAERWTLRAKGWRRNKAAQRRDPAGSAKPAKPAGAIKPSGSIKPSGPAGLAGPADPILPAVSPPVAGAMMNHELAPARPASVAVDEQAVAVMASAMPAGRAALVQRLFRAIETELTIIEERMQDRETRSPADSERDTRSIGALIRNLEKLTEFDGQLKGGGDKSGGVAGITADEADRIRRDLAARIERLIKS